MHWIFLFGVLASIPVLTSIFRSDPKRLVQGCFLLGLSMFVLAPSLWAAPIPWPGWPGPVKGLEVSYVDGVAVAMILATKPVRIPWSIKLPFGLFCLGLLVSSFTGYQVEPAVFYDAQLIRSILLFIAIARVCAVTKGAPIALLAGLGAGLCYEAVLAVRQHFSGDPRPGGNLGHSNFLGLTSEFVTFPVLAALLAGRRLWPAAVLFAAFLIAVVGGSRATLGLFAIGFVLTLVLSIKHGRSSRKYAFGSAAVLLLLIASPVMLWGVHQRSDQSVDASDSERTSMKAAARMIMADHPFGVGANNYVLVANTGGYSQRAGVAWNWANRSAPVHDVYYLVGAETGLLGLTGFVLTIAAFILLGFRNLKRRGDDESNELIPGLLAAMIIVSVHISYEWVFMSFMPHYMFAIAGGMLVGLTASPRKVAPPRPALVALAEPSHA